VLRNNGADGLSVSTNGAFSFSTALADAATYNVTVASAPSNPSQVCTATNATGTIAGTNVNSVLVSCTPPTASATLSFLPARLLAVYDQGDNRTLQVNVIPSTALTAVSAARVVDTVGVFESAFQLYKNVDNTYTAYLQTKKTLAAGAYVGNLTIELCQDVNCTAQHPGSPALLPYDVRVVSISPNLKSLSPVSGGTDWAMHASNPAHNGYLPVTIDPAQFSRRWQWRPQDPKIKNLSDIVTSQGRVFLTTNAGFMGTDPGGGYYVIAIDETGGSSLWTYPISNSTGAGVHTMNPPSVVDGKVYAVAGNNPSSTLYALDAANANLIWSTGFATQWDYYDTPTVMNGLIVNHAGFNSGGIAAFDVITGGMKWLNDCPVSLCDFTHSGAVAMDAANAYAVMPKSSTESGTPVLRAYDQALGQVAYSIDTASLPLYAFMLDPSPSPVIGGANSVLIGYWYVASTYPTALSKFRLERFDTANRTSLWHIDSDAITGLPSSSINPIVATGVVYAVNPALNRVEARNESDGTLLWTWTPPLDDQSPFMDGQSLLDFGSSMVVTNNILFVATRRFVYGVSLTSHQNVWSHWNTGKLSISANGVLYIKSTALFVDAINLQ
jgi:outer membrane protein assembly factor BamB